MAKIVFVFFLFAMAKAIVPRYRYDQLMRLGWKVFLPISLLMVVVVAAVLQLRPEMGGMIHEPEHRWCDCRVWSSASWASCSYRSRHRASRATVSALSLPKPPVSCASVAIVDLVLFTVHYRLFRWSDDRIWNQQLN